MRSGLRLIIALCLAAPAVAGAQGTFTPLGTFTPIRSFTPIRTFTPIETFTPVRSFTPIPTSTFPGPTRNPTRTRTPSRTATATPSATPTGATPTASVTRSASRTPTRTSRPASPTPFAYCVGDCSGDGVIVVNEIIFGVLIAQNPNGLSSCGAFDRNGDQLVTIDELVVAVGYALNGCP